MLNGAIAAILGIMVAAWGEVNLGDSEVLAMFLAIVACGYSVIAAQKEPQGCVIRVRYGAGGLPQRPVPDASRRTARARHVGRRGQECPARARDCCPTKAPLASDPRRSCADYRPSGEAQPARRSCRPPPPSIIVIETGVVNTGSGLTAFFADGISEVVHARVIGDFRSGKLRIGRPRQVVDIAVLRGDPVQRLTWWSRSLCGW